MDAGVAEAGAAVDSIIRYQASQQQSTEQPQQQTNGGNTDLVLLLVIVAVCLAILFCKKELAKLDPKVRGRILIGARALIAGVLAVAVARALLH
jgi:hypothetical protein